MSFLRSHCSFVDEESPPPLKKKPKKTSQEPTLTAESLRASSGHHKTEKPSKLKPRKKQSQQTPSQQRKPNFSSSVNSPSLSLPIQFSRARLKGYFGLPYSGMVHVDRGGDVLPPQQLKVESGFRGVGAPVGGASEKWAGQDMNFAMAPGVTDRVDPEAQKGFSSVNGFLRFQFSTFIVYLSAQEKEKEAFTSSPWRPSKGG